MSFIENKAATFPFYESYISQPDTLADEVLINDTQGGSLTLPVKSGGVSVAYTIPFYMTDNFSFSLGNNWSELVNMDAVKAINDFINLAGTMNGNTQVTLQSRQMMSATWTGSEIPEFSINTMFVCTQRQYNPVKIIKALAATCLPLELDDASAPEALKSLRDGGAEVISNLGTGIGSVVSNFGNTGKNIGDGLSKSMNKISNLVKKAGMAAPLGYGLTLDEQDGLTPLPGTTLSLRIGNWFNASELIVKSIGNIEFSKEVVAPVNYENKNYGNDSYIGNLLYGSSEYGFPLYARCTITLRPITYITPKEFNNYFVSTQGAGGILNSALNSIKLGL